MYLFINLFIDLFIYFLFIHSDRELQTHSIFSEEFLTFTYFLFSRTTYVDTYSWGYSMPFQLIGSPSPQTFFPECVAKSSRFTFGGLGVDPCSRDPAFGVRNHPRTTVVGATLPFLWEKSQKRDFLDVSEAVVMSFCVAGVALCDIPTCFKTRQKYSKVSPFEFKLQSMLPCDTYRGLHFSVAKR